jgi:Xaa-Pro aminopeptidase
MGGRGVLLAVAAPERLRAGDTHWPFRQDGDFDHLTGLDEPEAVAVIAPGHAEPFALFVRPRDPEMALWVGPRAGVEGAVADHGATVAHPITALERELPRWLKDADAVWLPLFRDDALARRVFGIVRGVVAQAPRQGGGPRTFHDTADLMAEVRLRKAPWEIDRLRATIAIAAEAHADAMRTVRPGEAEYEIEARIDGLFRRRGATAPAYPSIVASGPHACVLHHTPRDRVLGQDELLLIDAGSERAGYCADITRTFPTGRAFTGPQRDLYDAVLASQLAAIAMTKPGETLDAIHAKTCRVLSEALTHLGLLHGSVDEIVEKEHYRRFYMHRTSHWLGRDVHDVGRYKEGGVPRPLEPGMVFTIEPGLYVPTEWDDVPPPFRGLGIRIEDDVLVTPEGHEVLTAAAPKHVHEIEALRAAALG